MFTEIHDKNAEFKARVNKYLQILLSHYKWRNNANDTYLMRNGSTAFLLLFTNFIIN